VEVPFFAIVQTTVPEPPSVSYINILHFLKVPAACVVNSTPLAVALEPTAVPKNQKKRVEDAAMAHPPIYIRHLDAHPAAA